MTVTTTEFLEALEAVPPEERCWSEEVDYLMDAVRMEQEMAEANNPQAEDRGRCRHEDRYPDRIGAGAGRRSRRVP